MQNQRPLNTSRTPTAANYTNMHLSNKIFIRTIQTTNNETNKQNLLMQNTQICISQTRFPSLKTNHLGNIQTNKQNQLMQNTHVSILIEISISKNKVSNNQTNKQNTHTHIYMNQKQSFNRKTHHKQMHRSQYRFSSAGGTLAMARSQTSRIRSLFPTLSSSRM